MAEPFRLDCLYCHKAKKAQDITVVVDGDMLNVWCQNHDEDMFIFDMPIHPETSRRLVDYHAGEEEAGDTVH